jgi:hypothetical protein
MESSAVPGFSFEARLLDHKSTFCLFISVLDAEGSMDSKNALDPPTEYGYE